MNTSIVHMLIQDLLRNTMIPGMFYVLVSARAVWFLVSFVCGSMLVYPGWAPIHD